MRSLAVRLVSLEIRPSKMLNVVSKQKKLYKNGFAPFKGNCLVSSILKMVTIKPKWSTTTIGSEALALSTSLRDVGKYFTVNAMMSKESVKNGLKQGFLTQSLPTKLCKAMTSTSSTKNTM